MEISEKDASFEVKVGGYNRWADGAHTQVVKPAINPLFGDFEETQEENGGEENQTDPNLVNEDGVPNLSGQAPPNTPDDDEEDEETDEEGQEGSEEGGGEEIDNPAYFIAQQLVADGVVALEDIDKNISFNDIYSNYKESLEPQVKQAVLSEVQNTLTQAGITDENIIMLQAIQNGVPVDELYTVTRYKKYATADAEELEQDAKLQVVKEWYALRNLSEKEIKRNLEAIDVNDEVDAEFEEAQKSFGTIVTDYEKQQREISLENLRRNQEIQKRNEAILDKVINMGQIYEDKITSAQSKEIKDDIYNRTKQIQTEEGVLPVSPFEEFMYRLNNDLEFQLLQYKNFKYKGKEAEIIKEQVKEETEKDFLAAWKKSQNKSSSKSSIKRGEQATGGATTTRTPTGGFNMEF